MVTDNQKILYFNNLVKTLNIICNSAEKPVFGERVTLKFIHETALDTLKVLENAERPDTSGNDKDPVE